jgi:predicted nucleic acid-binding Zn ribbon protein
VREREDRVDARRRARQAEQRARLDRTASLEPPGEDDFTLAEEGDSALRRLPAPEPIGDLVGGLAARRGWTERLTGARLEAAWEDVVGTELARRCRPVRLADHTLVVRAESAVWATQLRYVTSQLLERIGTALGDPRTVRRIRITVGPLDADLLPSEQPGGAD